MTNLNRYPSLAKVVEELAAFIDARKYGQFVITLRPGRIVHYTKTESVQIINDNRQSEERLQATANGKESSQWPSTS